MEANGREMVLESMSYWKGWREEHRMRDSLCPSALDGQPSVPDTVSLTGYVRCWFFWLLAELPWCCGIKWVQGNGDCS